MEPEVSVLVVCLYLTLYERHIGRIVGNIEWQLIDRLTGSTERDDDVSNIELRDGKRNTLKGDYQRDGNTADG